MVDNSTTDSWWRCAKCGHEEFTIESARPQITATRHRAPAVVIADAIELICGDGRANPMKVAEDVIMALGVAGYEIVPAWEPLNV